MTCSLNFSILVGVICALPWCMFADAAFVYQYSNKNAHIAYKGDVSITWNTFTKKGDPCTIQMGPQNHSWFYIGVHPSWDPNPMFFELNHVSSVTCDSDGENCVDFESTESGGLFVYTNDEIYNLDFPSSVIELNFDRGEDGEFELQRTVDFGKARTNKAKLDGKDGYRIQLGKDSWLNNNTFTPSVRLDYKGNEDRTRDFENDCHLDPEYGTDFVVQEWTGIHDDFGIDFTFTNSKAEASFYLKANRTEMILKFTGNRNVSGITNEFWDYPEIDLDTSDPRIPRFNWRGGGAVAFEGDGPRRPTAVPTDPPTTTESVESTTTKSVKSTTTESVESTTRMAPSSSRDSSMVESRTVTNTDSLPMPSETKIPGMVTPLTSTETTGPTSSQAGPGSETSAPSLSPKFSLDSTFLWFFFILGSVILL